MRLMRFLILSIPVVCAGVGTDARAQNYRYAIINVGDPGGTGLTDARGINNAGVVVGFSNDKGSGYFEAFVWENGSSRFLPRLPGYGETFGYDINDRGDVVGRSGNPNRDRRAVYWPFDGGVIDLGTLGGDEAIAWGINSQGYIVGEADLPGSGSNAFLWKEGKMTPLGDFGRSGGEAQAINDAGQIVGSATSPSNVEAFLWENGNLIQLGGLLTDKRSSANDINESEIIVGVANVLDNTDRAVMWRDGGIVNIHDDRVGVESFARAVNESGQIAGTVVVYDFPLEFAAFLYEDNGPMVSLESLLPPNHKWIKVESAWDINDHGQIVGDGERFIGDSIAFLITPVTTELTLAQPSPWTADAINMLTVTGATPGKRVYFTYGTIGGGTLVPGCNHTDGITLQIENPKIIGSTIADQNGEATILRFVPSGARNLGDILIQAIQQNGCKMSQLVVEEFE